MNQSNIPFKWFPERLSPTSDFGLFSTCQHKWLLERVFFLRKATASASSGSIDLDAGGAFAKAMELTRNAYFKQQLPAETAIEIGQRYLLGDFATQFADSLYASSETLKTPTNLSHTFANYFADTGLDEERVLPYQLPDKSISVELPLFLDTPFKHPITRKPLQIQCILDLLGFDGESVVCVDEKTCKSVLLDSVKQTDLLRTETQFAFQVGMVNKLAPLLGIAGCNKMEVRKVVINNAKPLRKYAFYIEHAHQQLWWENVLDTINEMLKVYAKERGLRDYHLGCTSYFKPCEFTQACTSRLGNHLLQNGYTQQFRNRETNTLLPLATHIANVKAGLNSTGA